MSNATGNAVAPRNGTTALAAAPPDFKRLREFLEGAKGQLQMAAAKHISPDRMVRLALTAASKNDLLYKCRFQTVGLSLLTASALGLEPDGWEGHLVPYWNSKANGYDCQFIPDYKGFLKLMYANQRTLSVQAKAVYENDFFEFEFGTNEKLIHRPVMTDRGALKCAWAMVKFKDGACAIEVLTKQDVEKRKAASQSGKKGVGPWRDWEEMMWAKSAIKVLAKRAPLGEQVVKAADYDHKIDVGMVIQTPTDVDAVEAGTLPDEENPDSPGELLETAGAAQPAAGGDAPPMDGWDKPESGQVNGGGRKHK